jgi:hypothetical protein
MGSILLTVLCLACVNPEVQEENPDIEIAETQNDTLSVEMVNLTDEMRHELRISNTIAVLINRHSHIMIHSEKINIENAEEKIMSEYASRIEAYREKFEGNFQKNGNPDIVLGLQWDVKTNIEDLEKLKDAISSSLIKLRSSYSNKLFNMDFSSLSDSEKKHIHELIPLRILLYSPKNIGGK